jgi:hypothetical protein
MIARLAPLTLVALAACGMVSSYPTTILRPAEDAPERFTLADSSALTGTAGVATCRSPLVDPRNGARLTMQRAFRGNGDYSVPAGSYGVRGGELLRIDCSNGQAVGIVSG